MKLNIATLPSTDNFRFEPDHWLWCLHCERFFQGRDARADSKHSVQGCAFADCGAAGYLIDIFDWDYWPTNNPRLLPFWPTRDQLHKGLQASPDAGRKAIPTNEDLLREPQRYGVGVALNQDAARRNAILTAAMNAEEHEIEMFEDVDVATIEKLVEERFMIADAESFFHPNAASVIAFVRKWPQARVGGYVIPPGAANYGVWIDAIEYDLDTVPAEKQDELADELEKVFGDATHTGEAGDVIGAWWY